MTDSLQNVADYFKQTGQDPRYASWMMIPYAVGIGAYFLSYFIMFSPTINREYTMVPWIAALGHGWASGILGLYILHDSCHASFTRSPLVWDIMRRIYDLLAGMNTHIWIHQHSKL
jgi:fatty acid desaturase